MKDDNLTKEGKKTIKLIRNTREKMIEESHKKEKGKKNAKSNKTETIKWFIAIFITTFILSITFSYISTNALNKIEVIPAIIILIAVILVGIFFDVIGVAITVAKENEFHAKATKKVQGSKASIFLIRNSAKVANICADVIGDICGVLSGAISAIITTKITEQYGMAFNLQFIMSAMVASLTVGGKALGKSLAQKESTPIVHAVGKIFSIFIKE